MSNKHGPQALKTADTRERIFTVGRKLIREKGYNSVTIQEIIQQANISIGTFYYHFPSKNALMTEIFKPQNSYFEEEWVSDYTSADCKTEILDFFDRYAVMMDTMSLENVYELFFSAHGNKTFLMDNKDMHLKLAEIIEGFQKAGKIKADVSPQQIRHELFICTRGVVYDWCLHEGSYSLKEEIQVIISNYINFYLI